MGFCCDVLGEWVLVLLETPFKIPRLSPSDPSDHLMTLSIDQSPRLLTGLAYLYHTKRNE